MNTITIRVKQLPGLSEPVDLPNLTQCAVICGPNNGGKTRLLKGMVEKDNLEAGIELSDKVLHEFELPFKLNQFGSQRFPSSRTPANGLEVARKLLNGRKWWFPSDLEDFVRTAQDMYVDRFGPLGSQDGALMFAGNFRAMTALCVTPTVAYLPPKRRLTSPSNLIEPQRQLEIDSGTIVGQLFALKNAPLGDSKYQRFREVGDIFQRVTGAKFDVTFQPGSGSNFYLRFLPPRAKHYQDAHEVGMGYQDALTICFCLTEQDVNLLAIEEAENHLHPDIQRKLLHEFCSDKHKKHTIVSTHSAVFLERPERTRIFVCRSDRAPNVFDTTDNAVALASLGIVNLAPLTAGQLLLVEGITDVGAYGVLLDRLAISRRERVTIVPISGDNMIHFPLDVLKSVGTVKAIVDCDPKSAKTRDAFLKLCEEKGIPVHKLQRYAIENYFDADAYREIFPNFTSQIPMEIQPMSKVEDQIGFNPKSQLSRVADAVSLGSIESSDLGEALRRFYPEVDDVIAPSEVGRAAV